MAHFILGREARDARVLRVAIPNISDELTLERIRARTGCRIIPEQHSEGDIRQRIREKNGKNSDEILHSLESGYKPYGENSGEKNGKANSWESEPIINLVDSLMESALQKNATDIHFEPSEESFRVRLRIDGMLTEFKTLPHWIADSVLIRLKLLAQVDITERRLPHDGSFSFESSAGNINVRLSTLPVQCGEQPLEKCVLRLLKAKDDGGTLEDLHCSDAILKALRTVFDAPQGLFLITGPTGSGKTTTLYAGLREIIKKKINVTTLEDPVEYKLSGANQVQINEKCGLTFESALRSILRQDPDVILVGEIRDAETAQIALRAAQTGHLVLSTLHTNSAKAATSRLADLGISTAQLQDSLLGVVAQRLVRCLDRKFTTEQAKEPHYKGRRAIIEFLNPDGQYVEGTLRDNALLLMQQGITDKTEIERVLGKGEA